MRVSELIQQLQEVEKEHGDVIVYVNITDWIWPTDSDSYMPKTFNKAEFHYNFGIEYVNGVVLESK